MVSYLIRNKSYFMSRLLSSSCFDSFLLEEATIRMAVTFHIDGKLNQDFYDSEAWSDPSRRPYDLIPWSEVRQYCHDCIRGKRQPASLRFTFRLKPEFQEASLRDIADSTRRAVSSLGIAIRMNTAAAADSLLAEQQSASAAIPPVPPSGTAPGRSTPAGETEYTSASAGIHVVTGLSYQSFILDKSAEPAWDKTVERFLLSKGIDFEKEL